IRRGIDAPPRTVSSRISGPLLAGLRRGRLGDFFLVEVAVGLHRARKFQRSVGRDADALAFATRLQRDVVHRHDHHPRQRGDAADEPAELVVGAHHAQRDRLLGVELLRRLRTGLEQLVGDARGQRGLRDVHDQVGHLGLARQLAQHLLQLLLHLHQLELERLEVRGAALLGLELGAQLPLLVLQRLQLGALVAHQEPPRQRDDQQGHQRGEADLELARPAADVVEVQFLERPPAAPDAPPPVCAAASPAGTSSGTPSPSASTGAFGSAWVTRIVNTYGRPAAPGRASMISSSGRAIQPEPSSMRMYVLTLALDWARPSSVSTLPSWRGEVSTTPSGIERTSESNRWTICERFGYGC